MRSLLLIIFLLFSLSVPAQEWEPMGVKSGFLVRKAESDVSSKNRYKVVASINHNRKTILNAIQDSENCQLWVFKCIKNRMIEMQDLGTRYYHTTMDSPLLFKDRDFVVKSDVSYNKSEDVITVRMTSYPDRIPIQPKTIRIKDVEMIWKFKFKESNWTTVEFEIEIDPKIPLAYFVNRYTVSSALKTMQGLKRIVEDETYHESDFSVSELDLIAE